LKAREQKTQNKNNRINKIKQEIELKDLEDEIKNLELIHRKNELIHRKNLLQKKSYVEGEKLNNNYSIKNINEEEDLALLKKELEKKLIMKKIKKLDYEDDENDEKVNNKLPIHININQPPVIQKPIRAVNQGLFL
jgi:hypothetical protein